MKDTARIETTQAGQEARAPLVAKPLPKRRVLNTCRLPSNCR